MFNFPQYKSKPRTILEILQFCNTPRTINDLKEYDMSDIELLVNNKILCLIDNKYVIPNADAINLSKEVNKKFLCNPLKFIWQLHTSIINLENIYKRYENLLCNNQPSNTNKLIILKDEILVFCNTIIKIRDSLKTNFVATDSAGNITNNLINEYSCYQKDYQHKLTSTISDPYVNKFAEIIRNKLIHHQFNSLYLYRQGNHQFLLCEYYDIVKSHSINKATKKNAETYFFDKYYYIFAMNTQDVEATNNLNSKLQMYHNDANICVENVMPIPPNAPFLLYPYKAIISKNPWLKGQCLFHLSACLYNIYEAHITLYRYIYDKLLDKHHVDITSFEEQNKLLDKHSEAFAKVEIYNFKLPEKYQPQNKYSLKT